MKKLLTIALLGAAASLSYGQGTVNFSAGASALTRLSTNQVAGGAPTGQLQPIANTYYFALFVAPTTTGTNYSLSSSLDPTANGFTFFGAHGTNTAFLGRMNGNPDTAGTVVPGFIPSSSANFVVVGWSADIVGPDWTAFRAWWNNGNNATPGWAGHSFVASNVGLGGGLTAAGNIFGANPGQVPGFMLGFTPPVPEPSSFALMGLGAAALVIFRRRKA